MVATPESLHKFVNFCQQHIKGEERKEAQTFLDRFFRAFGHEGALEAGASYEEAIKKSSKKGKTGFADLVWKPRVLIEMKKRGEDLSKHYSQAFDYWTRLVPNRPRYVLLCNFDEFWIFDFDIQLDTPVDVIPLEQLPERAGAFAFMELGDKTPVFRNNQLVVTERAARRMGELLLELEKRKIEKLTAQGFILQCVLAMFAEDRQLLPRDMFISCVQDCMKGANSYDVLGGLFREMNQPGITPAGRYQGVDYFNGGLFSLIHGIDLTREELNFLDVSAREDWSKVRPAIFGNLFEGTVDKKERHARGIHFTSEADIMKIVRPTISRYWEERIEEATTIGELSALQLELQSYRVLDPACGSGNFLYMAYQELKRIEMLLLDKIAQRRKSANEQMQMGFVTPQQFYGMDTNPFAVELARVTLMIARKIAIDNFKLTEPALPLDTLDNNIVCQDALFSEWQKADVIIGNPPFLGGHRIRKELGDDYTEKVFKKFTEIKNQQIDIACYWFRLAHSQLEKKGRAGLVATNSICQGKSREASLDYVVKNNGYIHDAISSQPWSGEASVHVSIINWSQEKPQILYLDNCLVTAISSSLKSTIDVTKANRIKANIGCCIRGVEPNGNGFIVTEEQVKAWVTADSKNQEVLKLFSMGANLAKNPYGTPERWIIDFVNMSIEEASNYILPFRHVETFVKPERLNNRERILQQKWWIFKRTNEAMRTAITNLSCYFTVPRVSKWAVFIPASINWLAGDKSVVLTNDDFYVFGIVSSIVHRIWMNAQKSTLGETTAYTPTSCFETFPFPQTPDAKLVNQIRTKAGELHQYRTQQMEAKQWGITTLYNKFFNEPTSQLYKLHEQLDKLVMQAYGFNPNDDILEKLVELNLELAEKEKRGETIVGCWTPV
ncbi:MAG: N-6 DNA methylase [Tolypothrix brevis GSE-NOS-MK-07-07A]|jgi:SAM-dependent methyltransferase|nr:N-6 DNA methylase [Tolypothrix brevis GSE-NOS-MK-07-07A]